MQSPNMNQKPDVKAFFDQQSNTISYVVKDPQSEFCAVIDAVMQFDYAAGRLSYDSADEMINYISSNQLTLNGLLRLMSMQITYQAHHTSRKNWVEKLVLENIFNLYKRPLEKSLMRALNLSAMAHNSTNSLKITTNILLER